MSEELKIVDEESWVDLRIGDKAIVKGKTQFKQGDSSIMVRQPNWMDVLIEITDEGYAQTDGFRLLSSQVEVTVERTEDGLSCSTQDIKFVG